MKHTFFDEQDILKTPAICENKQVAAWQLCLKCYGIGRIWPENSTAFQDCPVCLGKMIINSNTGKPPE